MYEIYDYYEGEELIGTAETLKQAKHAETAWIEDTGGECDTVIYKIKNDGTREEVT